MTKIIKRPLSVLLAVLMIAGIFAALPLTAYAANNLTIYIMDMLENMDDHEWGYQLYDGDVSIAEGTYVQINMGTWHTGVMNIYMNGEVVYTKPSGSLYKDDVYHFTAGPNCKILGGYQNMFDWDGNPNVYITQDASVAVTGVTLNPNTAQTIDVGGSVAFTATVKPDDATDRKVKWSATGGVTLYTDQDCTEGNEVGTDATDTLTVYAKGISAGSATVTCTSNADSEKKASCDVTVNAAQTQTEELLTTITATGKEQANYSTANVATVSFSYTAGGSSAYLANWGWWGYGWSATVAPANGNTITKCVFYDNANHTATDSSSPFEVETTEDDKTPLVNGNVISNSDCKGIKKIEVYGYATPAHIHSFTYSASGATIMAACGEGCDITEGLTLTISAPTGDLTADGTTSFPATLNDDYNTTAFPGTYTIVYTKDGQPYDGTPTEAGDYTASVTVGTATASMSYTVISALAAAKTAAKGELDTLLAGKNEADYDADDWTALNTAIANGKSAIDNAATTDAVATAKSNAETAVNAIKTTAEKAAEALATAKTTAKGELDTLLAGKNEADYDANDWTALTQAIADGKTAIDNATTTDAVATAKSNAETAVNAIKTKAEKKDAADTAAANGASDTINALPAANAVTTADKDAIEAARAAYNALTADQKAKVSAETLQKLTDAETALAAAQKDAADTAAANDVSDTINALPAANAVTTADKDAIESARAAYNALTADQKAKVSAETLQKLTDAETALAAAQKDAADTAAANDVSDTINALPAANAVTTADKDAIEAARAAYNALTADQKAKVSAETLQKLTDAETALAAAQKDAADTAAANDVSDTINALPAANAVTTADKDAIEAARKAYDDLTDDQKAKVSEDTLKKLTDAETALAAAEKDAADTAAANTASEAINALPDADKVTVTDKDAIEAARKAYDDLTDDQKAKVDAETLKKLTDAETALAAAEKKAADEEKAAKELAAAKKNAQKAMNNQITVTQTGKKITVKWSKSTAADGYQVYVQYCGKKFSKPVKTIKKNSTTKVNITKINGKKINLKKQFKVYVKAYKIVKGKKVKLARSIIGHVVGVKNAKYTNVKSIKVTKSKLTVKVGKTAKVKAKVTLVDKNKKHIPKSHAAKFRYRTSNKKIATVTKSGKIKGIKKGTCTIYVYAINGKMKKVKVTVK